MLPQVTIKVTDEATPILADLHRELTDRTGLNKYMAATVETGARMHVRSAAAQRHDTADRLGAKPTNYLVKRAELIESKATADGAVLTLVGAIFKRAFGPVTVNATAKKMLTIPVRSEAYGRRAGEFSDLFLFRAKQGRLFLARRAGPGRLEFLYLLKRTVVLPQDKGLLPTQDQWSDMAELAGRAYLRKRLKEMGIQA
jgi:hypothetical protein